MLYKPTTGANQAAAVIHEPFLTTLDIPICNAKITNFKGTGGIFFIDPAKPSILYPLTARHILFHSDKEIETKPYRFSNSTGAPHRNVILLDEAAFKNCLKNIKAAIGAKNVIINQLNKCLALADKIEDKNNAIIEQKAIQLKVDKANEAIKAFKKLLADVIRDWREEENCVIGHIILSPPISLNYGNNGFTND